MRPCRSAERRLQDLSERRRAPLACYPPR
ncbi:MAG: hypothetical protein P8N98_18865 [Paracoccaceae bacterium]|nr:hypothetical protein [Paracoccaceae bacterium]